jgi:hypothetical protein
MDDLLSEPVSRKFRLEECVRLEEVCVPLSDCYCVVPGPVSDDDLRELTRQSFDQAPVYDDTSKRYYGLVTTSYLQELQRKDLPLKGDDPAIRTTEFRVGSYVTIFDVVDILRTSSAVVVIQESDATEYGHTECLLGILTISDLNKHAVRSPLYRLISETEAEVARLVLETIPDPWEWIKLLSEDYQVRVLGYWELAKRKDVDIGPIAAVTLTNLLTIIGKSPELRTLLGYASRSAFEKYAGKIPDFRNRTMHPVRPLILNGEEVQELYIVIRFLECLRNRSLKEVMLRRAQQCAPLERRNDPGPQ